VRASNRAILIASRAAEPPRVVVLAYDSSPAAERALERCADSALLRDLPVHLVVAGPGDDRHRHLIEHARARLDGWELMTRSSTAVPRTSSLL
jgi:hypothetical protein